MKFTADRPWSDPEKAARKLLEIANSVEVVQDGRIYIELINAPSCFGSRQRRPNIAPASSWRSNAVGWCCTTAEPMRHEIDTRLEQAA